MEYFPSYLLGFLVATALIWLLQPLARFAGLVDHPGGRKKHDGTIPLIGGIAMYFGLVVAVAGIQAPIEGIGGLLLGCGVLLVVGTIDDKKGLSTWVRFLAQIVAALVMVFVSGVKLTSLGHLFGSEAIELGMWSVPFTVFATVGVINALNMSDGMDGLAGGLTLVTVLGLMVAAAMGGNENLYYLFPGIVAVLVAFLMFNMRTPWRSHAKIFMGNGGSMMLGFTVAWLLVSLSQGDKPSVAPATALWLFALPLLDTVCIMIRRVIKGRSPFAPDREHFHHILLVAGYSSGQSVAIMYALAALLATVGILVDAFGLSETIMFIAFLGLYALYFWGMNHAWRVMKAIKREHAPELHEQEKITGSTTTSRVQE